MRRSTLLVAILSSATVARSQATERWCDEGQTGICFQRYYEQDLETGWGYIFPQDSPSGGVPDEFIGIFTAPASAGWIGNSLGGQMVSNPLVIGWINEFSPVVSVRRVEFYGLPQVVNGPKLTVLGGSGVTSSGQQRIIYRCQNCTSWSGGSGGIHLNGASNFGFAVHGAIKPIEPANANSSLYQHTLAGQHSLDVDSAKSPDYWDHLSSLQDLPMLPPPTPTATTTLPSPTGVLSCPGGPAPVYPLVVAQGWQAVPVLSRLSRPRSVIVDGKGHLLVLEGEKGVTAHTLDANGCVTGSKVIIPDTTLNHGLDLTPRGDKIIASSSGTVWSWDYDPRSLNVSNKRTLIKEMSVDGHTTRTVWVSRKYPNYLLTSVGSNENIDLGSFEADSGRAQVRVFDMNRLPAGGAPYTSGKVMGYGLRNDVGIVEDRNGTIFSVENSVDNAYRSVNGTQKDVHTDNPAEKLYRLGNPTNPTNLFGGYPYCYTVWNNNDFTDAAMEPGHWFVQAPNATMNDRWCQRNSEKPIALLPPHTAPLDIKLGTRSKDTNLYVTLHGSWNRSPPQGYKVVVVPGKYSSSGEWRPVGNLSSTKTSFTNLLSNRDETKCQSGCFRPVGLTFADGGNRIYVSSDASGEVFMLQRNIAPSPGSPPQSKSAADTLTAPISSSPPTTTTIFTAEKTNTTTQSSSTFQQTVRASPAVVDADSGVVRLSVRRALFAAVSISSSVIVYWGI